jgi:hypothetical protein
LEAVSHVRNELVRTYSFHASIPEFRGRKVPLVERDDVFGFGVDYSRQDVSIRRIRKLPSRPRGTSNPSVPTRVVRQAESSATPVVPVSVATPIVGLLARLCPDVLGQFSFHHLVPHVLQKHLYAFVSKQNVAEGLLVERNLNLGSSSSVWSIRR